MDSVQVLGRLRKFSFSLWREIVNFVFFEIFLEFREIYDFIFAKFRKSQINFVKISCFARFLKCCFTATLCALCNPRDASRDKLSRAGGEPGVWGGGAGGHGRGVLPAVQPAAHHSAQGQQHTSQDRYVSAGPTNSGFEGGGVGGSGSGQIKNNLRIRILINNLYLDL